MTIQYFDIKDLRIAPENPRKQRSAERIEAYAENILENGLIHSLAGYKAGKKAVKGMITAGGTRLEALRLLVKQGKLDADFFTKIPVNIEPKDKAIAIGLSSNEMAATMRASDQCRAYNQLVEKGIPLEDIAKQYFTDVMTVKRMIALATLYEPIFDALDDSKITLDIAKLYSSASPARQKDTWDTLGADGSLYAVRNSLRENTFKSTDRMVEFCGGVDAYRERGGVCEEDLFNEEIVLLSTDIISTMFDERIDAVNQSFKDAGWSEVIYYSGWQDLDKHERRLSRIYPKYRPDDDAKALMAELKEKFTAVSSKEDDLTDAEQKQVQSLDLAMDTLREQHTRCTLKQIETGTILWTVGHSGKVDVTYCVPKERAKGKAKEVKVWPDKFVAEVNRTAGSALTDHLVANPNRNVMCLLLASMDRVRGGGLTAKMSEAKPLKYNHEGYTTDDRFVEWSDTFRNLHEVYAELCEMDDEALYAYAATIFRRSFDMGWAGIPSDDNIGGHNIYQALASVSGFQLADYYMLGEDELKSLNKTQLLRCMQEIGMDTSSFEKAKKSELVKVLARRGQDVRWMPDFIRTQEPVYVTHAVISDETEETAVSPKQAAS